MVYTREVLPAIDMYETNGDVMVKTAMPGPKPEDIHISVSDDTLTIKERRNMYPKLYPVSISIYIDRDQPP